MTSSSSLPLLKQHSTLQQASCVPLATSSSASMLNVWEAWLYQMISGNRYVAVGVCRVECTAILRAVECMLFIWMICVFDC